MEELKQLTRCAELDCKICPQMFDRFLILLGVGDSERRPSVAIMVRLWENLLKDSTNPRFRTVPLTLGKIKLDLAPVKEALDFMAAVGWEREGDTLVWKGVDTQHLQLSNIFFSQAESLSVAQQKYVAEKHKEYLAQEAEKRALNRRPPYNPRYSLKWQPVDRGPIIKGVKGLRNLGNTCFFNSVMQCLLQTPQLIKIQIPRFEENITYPKDELDPLARSTCLFFEEMWTIDTFPSRIYEPKALFTSFVRKIPKFGTYQQQDSEEFLRCFFDELQSEKKRLDFISDIFQGKLCSVIKCLSCGCESLRKEDFITLSLSLPPPSPKEVVNSLKGTPKPQVDLDCCLEQFVGTELLKKEEGNGVQCFTCTRRAWVSAGAPLEQLTKFYPNEEKSYIDIDTPQDVDPEFKPVIEGDKKPSLIQRSMEKTMTIEELPKCLIVHLKRFQQNQKGAFEKISTHIEVPDSIDLVPYLRNKEPTNSSAVYKLYGYCSHLGGINGGHYTATTHLYDPILAERSDWYFFSDSHYHKIEENEITKKHNAYLVFYSREELPTK